MRHLYNIFTDRKRVNLDISNKCTLECIACSRQTNRFNGTPIPGKDMTISQWKKLVKHYKRFSLCGQISDPIFNPNLLEFIKIAKDNNALVSIHTAATAKNKKLDWYIKAFELYKAGVSWKFGIDGFPDVSPIYRTNQDAEFLFNVMIKGNEIGADVKWQFIIFSFNYLNFCFTLFKRYYICFFLIIFGIFSRNLLGIFKFLFNYFFFRLF